jgi:hypothetical protein
MDGRDGQRRAAAVTGAGRSAAKRRASGHHWSSPRGGQALLDWVQLGGGARSSASAEQCRSGDRTLTAAYARGYVSPGVGWPGPATPSASAPGPAGRSCTSPSCIDDSVRGGSEWEAPLSGCFRLTTNQATVNSTATAPKATTVAAPTLTPPVFPATVRPNRDRRIFSDGGGTAAWPWHLAAGPVRAARYEPRGTGDRATAG